MYQGREAVRAPSPFKDAWQAGNGGGAGGHGSGGNDPHSYEDRFAAKQAMNEVTFQPQAAVGDLSWARRDQLQGPPPVAPLYLQAHLPVAPQQQKKNLTSAAAEFGWGGDFEASSWGGGGGGVAGGVAGMTNPSWPPASAAPPTSPPPHQYEYGKYPEESAAFPTSANAGQQRRVAANSRQGKSQRVKRKGGDLHHGIPPSVWCSGDHGQSKP